MVYLEIWILAILVGCIHPQPKPLLGLKFVVPLFYSHDVSYVIQDFSTYLLITSLIYLIWVVYCQISWCSWVEHKKLSLVAFGSFIKLSKGRNLFLCRFSPSNRPKFNLDVFSLTMLSSLVFPQMSIRLSILVKGIKNKKWFSFCDHSLSY